MEHGIKEESLLEEFNKVDRYVNYNLDILNMLECRHLISTGEANLEEMYEYVINKYNLDNYIKGGCEIRDLVTDIVTNKIGMSLLTLIERGEISLTDEDKYFITEIGLKTSRIMNRNR